MLTEENNKLRLWTRQHESVLENLEKDGVYRAKKEYIVTRMGDHADVYLDAYRWYTNRAKDIVSKPEEVDYPIWLATSPDQVPPLRDDADHVMLVIEVDESETIILDETKWGHVVNFWYIPEDEEDAEEHKKQLEKYNISSETSIYIEDFYPLLKQKIVDSWDRLFDPEIKLSDQTVATLWEIREEWVVDVIKEEEEWKAYGD